MTFWSTEKLVSYGSSLASPYDRSRIKHGAYELAMGAEAFITSSDDGRKSFLGHHEDLTVPAGQFALLLTEEVIEIPATTLGLISMRYSIKSKGLVNISGFHVDPGFTGRLKFAVYNAGPRAITITRGQAIFLLWLADLDTETRDTYKVESGQFTHITSEDQNRLHGDLASPANLQQGLKELGYRMTRFLWVGGVLVALMGAVAIKTLLVDPWASSRALFDKYSARLIEVERSILAVQSVLEKGPSPDGSPEADEDWRHNSVESNIQEPSGSVEPSSLKEPQ